MYIYTCTEEFESMLTCIYDVWAAKHGSANVRLELEPVGQQAMFCTYIHVEPDPTKSAKVVRSIQNKISWEAYRQVYLAAMSDEADRLDAIYRFLLLGFAAGASITKRMADVPVMRLFELSRRAGNDMHYYREFTRFTRIEPGIYVAHIEPVCNIVGLTAYHFADRMPSEDWMLIDDRRRIAAVHRSDQPFYVIKLTKEEILRLQRTEEYRDIYTTLWQEFFQTIAIRARENPDCQRTHFPLHYRKHVTEFQDP